MVKDLEDLCTLMGDIADVEGEDIVSPKRYWPLPACRYVLFDHYRKRGMTGNRIAEMFHRDHATVFTGIKQLHNWLDSKDTFICDIYERFNDRCEALVRGGTQTGG